MGSKLVFAIGWISWQFVTIVGSITTSVACAVGPSVTTSSTDFSFQNLVFGNLFEFSAAKKSLKDQYLPYSESKSYQLNSIKSSYQDLSNNTKDGTF